jgi:hypothetical protein
MTQPAADGVPTQLPGATDRRDGGTFCTATPRQRLLPGNKGSSYGVRSPTGSRGRATAAGGVAISPMSLLKLKVNVTSLLSAVKSSTHARRGRRRPYARSTGGRISSGHGVRHDIAVRASPQRPGRNSSCPGYAPARLTTFFADELPPAARREGNRDVEPAIPVGRHTHRRPSPPIGSS